MALAETAQLVVDLRLNDQLSGGVSRAEAQLAGLNRTTTGSVGATGMLGGAFRGLSGAAEGVGGAMSHAGSQLKGLVTGPAGILAMTGGTLALGAALKDTVTSATDFQSAMELIATQAGGTQAEVEAMTKGIMAMATSVGTSPDVLAAGLYHIESAGLRGAQALDILKIAAEGAKVGNADLESVTNAMIASVTSGISGVSNMGQAMGTLNAIVGAGNMRMQDLTDAFGTGILSTAKTFGVSLQSVGAAIADMTNQGVPAIDAATRLRMSMSLLAAPTAQAAKLFESVGLGQLTLANEMRGPGGIAAAIQDLAKHMQKAGLIDANGQPNAAGADFLSKAFGGGRSSSAIMTLIGSLGKLNDIQTQINQGASGFDAAWTKTTQEAEFKFAKFQAAVGTLAIRLGDALLPTLSSIADAASTWLGDPANQQSLVGGLDAAMGLAKDFGSAVKDFILPPLKALGDIIGAIPGPIKEAVAAGFLLNKSMGWLFGVSPLKVGTNVLGSLLGPLLGRVPVVGGVAAGAMGVPHVWVDNMPLGGFGGGGGLPNIIPGAGGAAGTATTIAESGLVSFLSSGAGLGLIVTAGVAILAADAIATSGNRGPSGYNPNLPASQNFNTYGGQSVGGERQTRNPAFITTQQEAQRGVATAGGSLADMTGLMPHFGALAAEGALTYAAAHTKATRDNYAQDAVIARQTAANTATTAARLRVVEANTAPGTKAAAAAERSLAATQAVRDRLAHLNAQEDTGNARLRTIAGKDFSPKVNVQTNVHTSVSVADINNGVVRTRFNGGAYAVYGNRPSGASGGV